MHVYDFETKDGDYVKIYGIKMLTTNGELLIEFRNSSNGYYGGNIIWPGEEYSYGAMFSNEDWLHLECKIPQLPPKTQNPKPKPPQKK